MANAQLLDDMHAPSPQQPRRDNITMLQLDDVCADLLHLGVMGVAPLDDPILIPGLPGEISDQVEIEPADEHVEMVLDLEGVSIDDPVRMYLREIGRVSLLTADHEVALAKRMERGECLGGAIDRLERKYGFVPPSEVVCLELYEALVSNWPVLEEVYFVHYSDRPP